jgi:hypothetical protein
MRNAAITVGLLFLFGAWIWSGVEELTQVECEVCMEFEGRRACSGGLGVDETEATQIARSTACAPLAGGVTETFACNRARPASVSCETR